MKHPSHVDMHFHAYYATIFIYLRVRGHAKQFGCKEITARDMAGHI